MRRSNSKKARKERFENLQTLATWAQRLDPDGKVRRIVIELLAETDNILDDIHWSEYIFYDPEKNRIFTGYGGENGDQVAEQINDLNNSNIVYIGDT